MGDVLKTSSLALVMVAGPQIITAILLATSVRAKKNSFAYVGGAVLASAISTTIFYFLAQALDLKGAGEKSGSTTVDWILVIVLVLAAVHVFLQRKKSDPPKYMAKLQTETPGGAFSLGFLLFLLMPTDLMMTFTVGTYLAAHGDHLWQAAGFLLITALLIGAPLLVLLLLGSRADRVLPAARDWMNKNAWVVSEVVIALFIVLELKSILTS